MPGTPTAITCRSLAEGGLVAGLAGAWLLVALYRLLAGGFWNSRRSAKRQLFLATLTGLLAACVEIGFDFQMHCFAFAFTLAVLLGAAAGNARAKKSVALPRLAFAPALLAAAMAFHLWIAALPLERARQQLAGEDPSSGLAGLEASLALDPLNAEAHFDRAEFWAGRTRSGVAKLEAFLPAWQSYQAAIGNFPQGGLFWLRAGMLLEAGWQLGQLPLSGPRMAPVLRAMEAAEAAPARETGPLPGKILAYYRRALERDPNNPYFHDVIAMALLRQDRPAEARRHVEESIFLEPELASHAIFLPYFGDAEFRRIARSAFRRSLEQKPRQPGIHRMLARWDLEEGRIDAARRELALAGAGESPDGDPEWTGIAAELAAPAGPGSRRQIPLAAVLRLRRMVAGQPRRRGPVLRGHAAAGDRPGISGRGPLAPRPAGVHPVSSKARFTNSSAGGTPPSRPMSLPPRLPR